MRCGSRPVFFWKPSYNHCPDRTVIAMSGPITAGYLLAQGTLMLAQKALKEAQAMKREYGDVVEQLRVRENELRHARQAQRSARLERMTAVRRDAARHAGRLERLRALALTLAEHEPHLAQQIPPAIAAPLGDDDAAWSEHTRALEQGARELETLVANASSASGERLRAMRAATAAAPTIDDVLGAFALQRQIQPGLDPAQAEKFRQTAARVLSRLEAGTESTLPVELQALAREIVLAPSVERAEALASELRLAVQRQRDASAAQARDAANARRILAELPEDAPVPLSRALERVAASIERMDAGLQQAAQQVLDTAAADRAAREQEAAAYVLEQSLRDLGYEVEDIEATLFADGGVVHFRRPGWESYFVRVRVDPRERTVNFNVVRARGDEQSAERLRLDTLAEDRWCAEFPRPAETLAARGLALDVTRRLEAGAVPVQIVDPAAMPRVRGDEDGAPPRSTPRARRIP